MCVIIALLLLQLIIGLMCINLILNTSITPHPLRKAQAVLKEAGWARVTVTKAYSALVHLLENKNVQRSTIYDENGHSWVLLMMASSVGFFYDAS